MRFWFLSKFGVFVKKSIKLAPRIMDFCVLKTENKRPLFAGFRIVDCRYSGIFSTAVSTGFSAANTRLNMRLESAGSGGRFHDPPKQAKNGHRQIGQPIYPIKTRFLSQKRRYPDSINPDRNGGFDSNFTHRFPHPIPRPPHLPIPATFSAHPPLGFWPAPQNETAQAGRSPDSQPPAERLLALL